MKPAYVAVDFGGGSGRVIAGSISGSRLHLDEIHRFRNVQRQVGKYLYWDFPALFDEMVVGLRKCVEAGYRIESVGIDTWGVDFGFIDAEGNLLSNPICYRDASFDGAAERFFNEVMSPEELYAMAGIQVMDINSLFRLYEMKRTCPTIMGAAWRLLFMPDLFSYFLTGEANNEYTISSTSELIDARTRDWNRELIRRAGLREDLFGEIVQPGATRGWLTADVRRRIGIDYEVPVKAVGSHDTASAVHCVQGDYDSSRTAYLSSGTWSLLGVLLKEPLLSEEARLGGFTNEGGVGGGIRFLQNITGLWILQCLMSQWENRGLNVDYGYLLSEAERAEISTVIDVDDEKFGAPLDMELAIVEYCQAHGLEVPKSQGDFVRVTVQSLADRYRRGVESLNRLLPAPLERLQIIGGGSRNGLLNRLTAQATGLVLITGPVEATAIGNILCQAGISPQAITEIE